MRKVNIDYNTIFSRGIRDTNFFWGSYLITGFQGTGKTLLSVWACVYKLKKTTKIKTNIHSLFIPNRCIEYFTKLEEIYNDYEEGVVYIIDELSKKFPKHSKCDVDFYSWLQQCRKRKRIVFCIMQEFKECPTWLRRPMVLSLNTRKFFNLQFTSIGDIQNSVLDENMEWSCPILYTLVWKKTKKLCSYYDTYEPVQDL